jgi:UPF0716 protein FxsA
MPALLFVAFVVVPIVELYVIVQVGHLIGVLPTLLLLFACSVAGAWLVKREGVKAWRAFRAATAEGRVPARETADGALVIVGGALLLAPGFVTDALGLLCVLPPTRALVRRLLLGFFLGRFGVVGQVENARTGVRVVKKVRSRRVR